MPRDWPDPRFPDRPLTWFEIALAGTLAVVGYAAMIWAVIDAVRLLIGLLSV